MKRLVYLASPFRGSTPALVARNVAYAERAMADSLARGEAPFVPHLLYTRVLRDEVESEREASMSVAAAWIARCDSLVAYVDLDVSQGMASEIHAAETLGIRVEYREIGGDLVPGGPAFFHPRRPPLERARWMLGANALPGVDDRTED